MLRRLPFLTHASVLVFLVAAVGSGCGRTPLRLTVGDAGVDAMPDGGPNCTTDEDCNDSVVCNGEERCLLGQCVVGAPLDCNDGVTCTVDRCLEVANGCEHISDPTRCAPGELCDTTLGCIAKTCASDAECNDGLLCNGVETCGMGSCVPGVAPSCTDAIGCTSDLCSEAAGGCLFVTDDALCADGLFCNGAEVCDPTLGCIPAVLGVCTAPNDCIEAVCDEAADMCLLSPADTDNDGAADSRCGGPDCADLDPSVFPGQVEACGNMIDDDCDGLVDCADAGCAAAPECQCIPSPELCTGGIDEDCDGLVDCLDPSCAGSTSCQVCVVESCTNSVDDDCDGLADCSDPDCTAHPACVTCVPEVCGNGQDDDCDNLADCADTDCAALPACCIPSPEICSDGADQDCDGLVDCADPSCTGNAACCAMTEVCNSGMDMDCDGFVGCMDSDCSSSPLCCTPQAENTNARCADLRDNDCDGLVDCADPSCASTARCQNCLATELCFSPFDFDLDCDGVGRCADPDCGPPFPFCIR